MIDGFLGEALSGSLPVAEEVNRPSILLGVAPVAIGEAALDPASGPAKLVGIGLLASAGGCLICPLTADTAAAGW